MDEGINDFQVCAGLESAICLEECDLTSATLQSGLSTEDLPVALKGAANELHEIKDWMKDVDLREHLNQSVGVYDWVALLLFLIFQD